MVIPNVLALFGAQRTSSGSFEGKIGSGQVSREYHVYNRIEWQQNMYWAWAAAFMCTRAKMRGPQVTARDARMYRTSGITAVELKIVGLNLWRMPIGTIRKFDIVRISEIVSGSLSGRQMVHDA